MFNRSTKEKKEKMRREGKIELYNEDNMLLMARYPDKYFDLAIVDPPYGIGEHGGKRRCSPSRPNSYTRPLKYENKGWDKEIPSEEYFTELFRVSKNQIIWGANYFTEYLPKSMGWIFWDKKTETNDFSDGELAFTSYQRALKKCRIHKFVGTKGGQLCIHPTQKPVGLYQWIYDNYSKPEFKVLDTHLGSGSNAIAAYFAGVDFVGCEIDKDYFDKMTKRYETETAQTKLF
jgi:site-specific DNA-methyltransferase (adenine-specific)